jgi:hypothetical protein
VHGLAPIASDVEGADRVARPLAYSVTILLQVHHPPGFALAFDTDQGSE